jgi:hypothetical protein
MSRRGAEGLSIVARTAQLAARTVAQIGFAEPFVHLLSRAIDTMPKSPPPGPDVYTLLALNPGRFRGELEGLLESGKFRILRLPYEWQCRLIHLFFSNDVPHDYYFHPDRSPPFARQQRRLRQFLVRVLRTVYSRFGVDAVVSSAVHYREDFEFGCVSEDLGYPYIVLQRENIIGGSGQRRRYEERSAKLGQFKGSHVICHNEEVRGCYLRSGFLRPEQVSALGCVRMDGLLDQLKAGAARKRPLVTFFSFAHGTGLLATQGYTHFDPQRTRGFVRLFETTHAEFARLAQERPDVDFVIRPKWRAEWEAQVTAVLQKHGLDWSHVPNLTLDAESNTHALIRESTLVIGFQSTVVLEAAVAGKALVVPMFKEANVAPYAEYVHFRDELEEVADVAHSEQEFAALLRRRLAHPEVDQRLMDTRRAVFAHHVSNLDAPAKDRYATKIRAIIDARRQARRAAA